MNKRCPLPSCHEQLERVARQEELTEPPEVGLIALVAFFHGLAVTRVVRGERARTGREVPWFSFLFLFFYFILANR